MNKLWLCCIMLLAGAGVLAGCQSVAPRSAAPDAVVDPCAARLQDISGLLLLYHTQNGGFPDDLDQLQSLAGYEGVPPLACPASGAPYVYDPQGWQAPGLPGRVIVRDAEAVHGGWRLGILVVESPDHKQVTAHVVPLSGELVPAAPPGALPPAP